MVRSSECILGAGCLELVLDRGTGIVGNGTAPALLVRRPRFNGGRDVVDARELRRDVAPLLGSEKGLRKAGLSTSVGLPGRIGCAGRVRGETGTMLVVDALPILATRGAIGVDGNQPILPALLDADECRDTGPA